MSLDLEYADEQVALGDALNRFCLAHADGLVAEPFPRRLWSELASLGVLTAGTPGGEGGPVEIAAAMEALGRGAFPGPLSETFVAMQVLTGAERAAVGDGSLIVCCGAPPLMAFAPVADLFLAVTADAVHRAETDGDIEPVEVLGGEPWGRLAVRPGEPLEGGRRALAIGVMARAAYLSGLAQRLVEEVAEHARTRKQFGRAIGEFQAVAHPLADCHVRLLAGRTLARRAAYWLDAGDLERGDRAAASASLSCAAGAVAAAHAGHQVYGAIGITLDGPAYRLTRRIRQLASAPPGPDRARERMLAGLDRVAA